MVHDGVLLGVVVLDEVLVVVAAIDDGLGERFAVLLYLQWNHICLASV